MAFSGALTLTDLNDFITPSQACIKPVEQTSAPLEKEPGAASTEIYIDSSGTYFEVPLSADAQARTSSTSAPTKLAPAQISLNDCLACSGCITSAESVLITLQSHTEVLNVLTSNGDPTSPTYKIPVISIAPQSLASLAASIAFSTPSTSDSAPITPLQVLRRVEVFCKEVLGFAQVFDTTFARHVALKEHTEEFLERRRDDAQGMEGQLPMLASACPGWICYAEKAHPEMLPFISRTKSPQQVMGTLVKEWMAKKWGKTPTDIYHVTVMPCYDKKLEASRQDFYNDIYSTRDVDCVITTGELELLMREKSWDISVPVPRELEEGACPDSVPVPRLLSHSGSSSGSYLQSLISHIRSTSSIPLILSVKTIRNADYEEYTLSEKINSGEIGNVVFKGAKCYGFRNLQNIVRKVGKERGIRTGSGAAGRMAGRAAVVRRGRKGDGVEKEKVKNYDYVEVMACPGGCVNGGGQLKPLMAGGMASGKDEGNHESGASVDGMQGAKWGDKNWTKKVEEAYWRQLPLRAHDLPTPPDTPPHTDRRQWLEKQSLEYADQLVDCVVEELCRKEGSSRQKMFRTEYRAVESEVVGLGVKW